MNQGCKWLAGSVIALFLVLGFSSPAAAGGECCEKAKKANAWCAGCGAGFANGEKTSCKGCHGLMLSKDGGWCAGCKVGHA